MGEDSGVHVIATTISGSIKDWGKVERIVPLFRQLGRDDVELHVVDSHAGRALDHGRPGGRGVPQGDFRGRVRHVQRRAGRGASTPVYAWAR